MALFSKTGITTVFVNLEGWPEDWRTNLPAVMKFFRDHHSPSFLEYGEYPYVSADEVKKALRVKSALSSHARSDAVTPNGCIGQDLRISATPADRSSNPK